MAEERSVSSPRAGSPAAEPAPTLTLSTLAPQYDEAQHGTYLHHLEAQVANPKNLNIALTGRYGTGKSSVLDKFEENHAKDTLRLGISALEPAEPGSKLTNRIQKELVKQLLYRASPDLLRNSRFSRIQPQRRAVVVIQTVLVVLVIGCLLALLGWLPPVAWTSTSYPLWARTLAWAVCIGLISAVIVTIRLVVLNRRELTDVAAAGASITLSAKGGTYFDEYLDEIVYFFAEVSPTYVILEDLDRFDDPHIFEALRELNTLLNSTAARRASGTPLRFIYAIKDSLFEQLGTGDADEARDDLAWSETVRANRTKFFDMVIPIVPFISHRNARELLAEILNSFGIGDIDRRLIDLVARFCTDMRLLRNICNEYIVFAGRLLHRDRVAPELNADNLFALVAFKNFHLKDFEEISRRNSDLDRIYDVSRDIVTRSIADCERVRRDVTTGRMAARARDALAARLDERLHGIAQALKDGANRREPNTHFVVDEGINWNAQPTGTAFWRRLRETSSIQIFTSNPNSGPSTLARLSGDQLRTVFPETYEEGRWDDEIEPAEFTSVVESVDHNIAFLRSADFGDLYREPRFTTDDDVPFSDVVASTLDSELAIELVAQGYIDRNFAIYAAQFYGNFTGVDVANFMVRNVQTNAMDAQYAFGSDDAVTNLLAEAPADFTRTVSALNIEVVGHLVARGDAALADVVEQIVRPTRREPREFLATFLNATHADRVGLVAALAPHMTDVYTYLVDHPDVPDDVRVPLVDAALLSSKVHTFYVIDAHVGDFLTAHYTELDAITAQVRAETLTAVQRVLEESGVVVPRLEPVHPALRTKLIDAERYRLTADNLRCALEVTESVGFDAIIEGEAVYGYCRENPTECLTVLVDDDLTPFTVEREESMVTVLNDVAESWDDGELKTLLTSAAPASRVSTLGEVPRSCWAALGATAMFRPTLQNAEDYMSEVGAVDEPLASLLLTAEGIESGNDNEEQRQRFAEAILNAGNVIPDAANRVSIVQKLELRDHLRPESLTPEPGDLFARLLGANLVADSAESFTHFKSGGWTSIEPAILASAGFSDFCGPELTQGLVAELLASERVSSVVRNRIIADLGAYVPQDDATALSAAAKYAAAHGQPVGLDQLRRIASAAGEDAVVTQLLAAADPTAAEIIEVFAALPAPYSHFATRAVTEFDVPETEALKSLISTLSDAGHVTHSQKRRGRARREIVLAAESE